ncbi:hypothetical protein K438DRAFT_1778068 [Mycena galopus ATCC 62051]|nr:hypothetical protein K438DRAFT_1778068 [Mycena galopus ATCC 62051]
MSAPKIRHSISVEEIPESEPNRGAPPLLYSNYLPIPADEPDVAQGKRRTLSQEGEAIVAPPALGHGPVGSGTESLSMTTPSANGGGWTPGVRAIFVTSLLRFASLSSAELRAPMITT